MGEIVEMLKPASMQSDASCYNGCENCIGMKCSSGFIYTMLKSIKTIPENQPKYVISNGPLLLSKLINKQLPKEEAVGIIADLMTQCSGCSHHDDNCIVSLTMQAVYYSMYGRLDKLDFNNIPSSIISSFDEKNTNISHEIRKAYLYALSKIKKVEKVYSV